MIMENDLYGGPFRGHMEAVMISINDNKQWPLTSFIRSSQFAMPLPHNELKLRKKSILIGQCM